MCAEPAAGGLTSAGTSLGGIRYERIGSGNSFQLTMARYDRANRGRNNAAA